MLGILIGCCRSYNFKKVQVQVVICLKVSIKLKFYFFSKLLQGCQGRVSRPPRCQPFPAGGLQPRPRGGRRTHVRGQRDRWRQSR